MQSLAGTIAVIERPACTGLGFERRYEQAVMPFEWKFTRHDLTVLMKNLTGQPSYPAAA